MEFVLVTTRSTPESSEGGSSIMKFGDYREDEDDRSASGASITDLYFKQLSSDSDEDLPLLADFNEESARQRLLKAKNCAKIVLSDEKQQDLDLVVGINVSEEHPWKQVTRQSLLDCFTEDDADLEIRNFREKLLLLEDTELILVGYAPTLSLAGDDTFLFFEDEESAKEATKIIQKFEAFERRKIKKILHKRARPWKSGGSEKEVDLQIEKRRTNLAEVEIQLLYPIGQAYKSLEHRFADDARDGYVEIVPKKEEMKTLMRTKIDVGIQTAPRRVELEQQTDPTFPANAWTQYFYEIRSKVDIKGKKSDAKGSDGEIEDDGKKAEEDKADDDIKYEAIASSEAVNQLLQALAFNAIDMYRDDYTLLAKKPFVSYTPPYLEEVFCFTDLKRTCKQYVCALDWHPTLSGVFIVSYAEQTLNSVLFTEDEEVKNMNENLINPTHQVLVWSFNDLLYPKLELEAPREVTNLSFCPFDENVLIGGTSNGQLIIWDLTDCLASVEIEETLNESQLNYRNKIYAYLQWTRSKGQRKIVKPVATTEISHSHKKDVTCIKWLSRNYYIASTGQILSSSKPGELYRHFVSASLDGTISFWDLDYIDPNEAKNVIVKRKYTLPEGMKEKISAYARLNGILRPTYTMAFEHPITNLMFDEGQFRFQPTEKMKKTDILTRIKYSVEEEYSENVTNKVITSSQLGVVSSFTWEGYRCKEGKPEYIKQADHYQPLHNGPIVNIGRNPFVPELFLTVGQNIVAIWNEAILLSPIFWRRRENHITDGKWSLIRASVFFLIRIDGNIELWDILTRTDKPCVTDNLGGHILTILSQHKLPMAVDVVTIGDHKGNIRVFTTPAGFSKPIADEVKHLREYMDHEVMRKQRFNEWQDKFVESNSETKENKKLFRDESKKLLERFEIEAKEKEDKRKSTDEQFRHHVKSKSVYDLPERLTKKWDAWNIKRLMTTLLTLKQFDPELLAIRIKPERDRLTYNEQKRRAIAAKMRQVNEDVAVIRSHLMPTATINRTEERIELITKNSKKILATSALDCKYENIEIDMKNQIEKFKHEKLNLNWNDILQRARDRRVTLNRILVKQKINSLN